VYPIPAETNLEFLVGCEVTAIHFGPCTVQIRLCPEPTNICIGGFLQHTDAAKAILSDCDVDADSPSACESLASLVGSLVRSAVVLDSKSIKIVFSNHESIELTDSSDHYESFTISDETNYIIV